jgi:glyoxylase-like metal-dependent hydrolase (beta-lactamase superfamily II)
MLLIDVQDYGSMADVKILNNGIVRREGDGWIAFPNTVLITDGKERILVDPGNHPKLIDIMEYRSIWPEEIKTIFLTHSHLDHILNLKLFPDAVVYDRWWVYEGTKMIPHQKSIPGTKIEIIPTPGHSHDHASLLVSTSKGRTAICGDLFWWEEDQEQKTDYSSLLFQEDIFAIDRDKLLSSRRAILRMADHFIPGHGEPFEVTK